MPRSGEQAKKRLIRAGEKLFARNGIDATTIAAITKEAGQRNNYAVGWHFGGKDELLQAQLAHINVFYIPDNRLWITSPISWSKTSSE